MGNGSPPIPGPLTLELIENLSETAALLRRCGEKHWSSWLERDAERLRRCDSEGIRHVLSAFGGMGSFNDLLLHPMNGDSIAESEVEALNKLLDERRGRIYSLAKQISAAMVFED